MLNQNINDIKARQQQQHDTEQNWEQAGNNGFIPLAGEIIVYDNLVGSKIKIGDGATNINDLPFLVGESNGLSVKFVFWGDDD